MKQASLVFGTLLVTGCSSLGQIELAGGPVEIFPVAPDAPEQWAASGVTGELPAGDWTLQFNDPVMTQLVEEAIASNPGLEAQIATLRAARFDLAAQRGTRLPSITGSGNAGARRTVFRLTGNPVKNDTAVYGLNLNASWEADLFGRISRGIELAGSQLELAEADLDAAQLSLAGQAALGWINLNAAIAQLRVAEATVEARQRVTDLTERRFARGLSTALDVRLARSALAGAEASLSARKQARGEAARQLEIVLGRYPSREIEAPARLPELDPIQPIGNPTLVLARRPDIAAAEARVVSAGLRAEQARLALLPTLNITGGLSTDSDIIREAFDPAFLAGSLLAGISQPLFTGGRLRRQRDAAIARAQAAVASYASAALTAWREVEDALAADVFLAEQEAAQMRSLEEAAFAEELAERQYRNGLVTIFNFIDAQTRRLNAESSLVSARSQRAANRINYHLALGGGLPGLPVSSTPDAAGTTGGSLTQ